MVEYVVPASAAPGDEFHFACSVGAHCQAKQYLTATVAAAVTKPPVTKPPVTKPPRKCCKAKIAKCLSCDAGETVGEYCSMNPKTKGCGAITEIDWVAGFTG